MALSTINTNQISSDAVTTPKVADQVFNAHRNLIINGAMQVAQRGTSSTTVSNAYLTVDRYSTIASAFDQLAITQSQSTTVPSGKGFGNSFKMEVTTAETALASDELFAFRQQIEGQNLQQLSYGTSSAKSLTLSFWVRSSLVGKYSLLFFNLDATRTNLQSFTINTANTWEYKTITIDGDTDGSGSLDNDNNGSLQVTWVFAAGTDWTGTPHTGWGAYTQTDDYAFSDQVDFTAQTGTFYLTGVQLELGDTATPFEHRSYDDELVKCQRYYQKYVNNKSGRDYLGTLQAYNATTTFGMLLPLFRPMRVPPTFGQSGTFNQHTNNSSASGSTTIALDSGASHGWVANGWGGINGLTAGDAVVSSATDNAELTADAEL